MQCIQYHSLTDQVYDALKRDIVRRKLAANAKLDVNGLATTLGVSRMPVADALTRLESEGLVEKRNRVGTFVAPVSQARLREWFETRSMIEDWAAPRIAERATQDDIEKLMRLLDDGRHTLKSLVRTHSTFTNSSRLTTRVFTLCYCRPQAIRSSSRPSPPFTVMPALVVASSRKQDKSQQVPKARPTMRTS